MEDGNIGNLNEQNGDTSSAAVSDYPEINVKTTGKNRENGTEKSVENQQKSAKNTAKNDVFYVENAINKVSFVAKSNSNKPNSNFDTNGKKDCSDTPHGTKNDEKAVRTESVQPLVSDGDKQQKNGRKTKKKRNLWSVKITVISLFLSAFISFISEMTASSEHMIVTIILLLFLILCSILFDGIGVAVTSCDITPIIAMSSRKLYGAKTALWLVKNNEKVSNVCNDVIGDIFGIISGACTAAIVAKIIINLGDGWQRWLTIGLSSVVAALTIGGKAFLKNIAITNSKEFVMFIARIIAVFSPEERRRKKKQTEKLKQAKAAAEKNAEAEYNNPDFRGVETENDDKKVLLSNKLSKKNNNVKKAAKDKTKKLRK